MNSPTQAKRDWSGIGCGVLLALLALSFVYATWSDPDRDLVRRRESFAEWLREQGATLTPADPSRPEDAKIQVSPHRQSLGDKPLRAVALPYGYPEGLTASAKALFPEVTEWSILPAETATRRLFGDSKFIEVVRHPDRVEAQRLTGDNHVPQSGKLSLEDFPTEGDVIDVAPQLVGRIADGLLNPEFFTYGNPTTCDRRYRVRLTYFRGPDRVDILFCFECSTLKTFSNEQFVRDATFSKGFNHFAGAVKEIFPHDKEIQALRPSNERGTN